MSELSGGELTVEGYIGPVQPEKRSVPVRVAVPVEPRGQVQVRLLTSGRVQTIPGTEEPQPVVVHSLISVNEHQEMDDLESS